MPGFAGDPLASAPAIRPNGRQPSVRRHERLCEQMDKTPEQMLDYLKSRGCTVGGVTMGERGLL